MKFAELKRVERDHAKEKQKLVKDKDSGMLLFLSHRLSQFNARKY